MGAVRKAAKDHKPKVIDYHDYRLFLKDWFAYLEKEESGFSLRQLARDSKVGASFISMMLSGHRGLSESMFAKIGPHLRLSGKDLELLDLLRALEEAPTPQIRLHVFAQIQKRPEYRERYHKEFEVFTYLTSWYYVAIRELAALPDFQFDARWIQGRLRENLPLEQIEKALLFLEKHGFLNRVRPYITKKTVECMGGIFTLSLGTFHRQMLNQISDSIESVPRDERLILGHTVAIARDQVDEAKSILNKALEQIAKLGEASKTPETVYHFTLAAVPLSVKKEDPDEN